MAMNDYLLSMPDAQLDALQSQGQLSPDIVNAIKAQRAPMAPMNVPTNPVQNAENDSASQGLLQNLTANTPAPMGGPSPTQVSNLDMSQTAPRATQVISGALDSAGLQPPSVPAPNAPLAPNVPPEQLAAVEQESANAAATQAAAQSGAQKAVAAEAARKQAEHDRLQTEAQAKDAALTQQVGKDLEEVPSLGSQIGQAIAIMMGAYSQGLTGAKENPAITAIEKTLEREAQKRKYTQEQKDKAMEMALKQAQFKLEERKADSQSVLENRRIQIAEKELGLKVAELQQKTSQNAMLSKLEFSPAEMAALQGEEGNRLRERMVRLPNGNFRPIARKEDAAKLTELTANNQEGQKTVRRLMDKVDFFGNNPVKKLTSFKEIGETKADLQALVGQMRLPYTGTGAFTAVEQAMLKGIAGDPAKIASLDTTNKAKLLTIMQKFKIQERSAYRANGIDLPLSSNETKLEQMKQKYPKASDTDLMNALIRDGKWNLNEN
jgi:hypothetical protein